MPPWNPALVESFRKLRENTSTPVKPEGHILVVEDNYAIALSIERELIRKQYMTTLVSDGVEAVQKVIDNKDYNAILMNVTMPRVDGFKATKYIRFKLKYGNPIIGFSVISYRNYVKEGLRCGMDEYINYMFGNTTLYEAMHRWIKTYQKKDKEGR